LFLIGVPLSSLSDADAHLKLLESWLIASWERVLGTLRLSGEYAMTIAPSVGD
jgi:hypothetical protein